MITAGRKWFVLVVRQQIAQLVKSPFKGCYGRKVKASIVAAIPCLRAWCLSVQFRLHVTLSSA